MHLTFVIEIVVCGNAVFSRTNQMSIDLRSWKLFIILNLILIASDYVMVAFDSASAWSWLIIIVELN